MPVRFPEVRRQHPDAKFSVPVPMQMPNSSIQMLQYRDVKDSVRMTDCNIYLVPESVFGCHDVCFQMPKCRYQKAVFWTFWYGPDPHL